MWMCIATMSTEAQLVAKMKDFSAKRPFLASVPARTAISDQTRAQSFYCDAYCLRSYYSERIACSLQHSEDSNTATVRYLISEVSLCVANRFKASADTSAELMYIARETLVNLVEQYPEFGQNIAKYVFDRYKEGRSDMEPVRPHI
jgi:hypothetical protein